MKEGRFHVDDAAVAAVLFCFVLFRFFVCLFGKSVPPRTSIQFVQEATRLHEALADDC